MFVYLWDADRWSGVSDSDGAALAAVVACITGGGAGTAKVELARVTLSPRLDKCYERSGVGWTARRDGDRVTWAGLPGLVPLARRTAPCPR
jgi:hypothetical protein